MDKLFMCEPVEMIEKLKSIEPEMREDSYKNDGDDFDNISGNTLAYINKVFIYMKKTWNADECTVFALMKE